MSRRQHTPQIRGGDHDLSRGAEPHPKPSGLFFEQIDNGGRPLTALQLRNGIDGLNCMFRFAQNIGQYIPQWYLLGSEVQNADIMRVKASVAGSAREFAPWHEEFRYRHPTKGEIWLEGHSSPQVEADGSILWHGFVHDVSERKRAEYALAQAKVELERRVAERTVELTQEMQKREAAQAALAQAQRLEAVGRLAGGLVHDFNNALTAISTNLELAEARIADPEARDAVHKALEAVELSAGLNRRLLTFARRGTFTRQIVSVNDRVTGVLQLLERAVGPNLALKADLASDLWPTEIDPSEIDSAILNLAINARDAMPRGGALRIQDRQCHAR